MKACSRALKQERHEHRALLFGNKKERKFFLFFLIKKNKKNKNKK
jgi:hypothetical protein